MAVLGHDVPRGDLGPGGLGSLLEQLSALEARPTVTLFVVGHYAAEIRSTLAEFAAAGHEIASHGPDHGRLPVQGIAHWLRQGREMLEDLLGVPVTGFRSPRFDLPEGIGLARYREHLAEAGYDYVSDAVVPRARFSTARAPCIELAGGSRRRRQLPAAAAHGRRDPGRGAPHGTGCAVLPLLRLRRHRPRGARGALRRTGQAGARSAPDRHHLPGPDETIRE